MDVASTSFVTLKAENHNEKLKIIKKAVHDDKKVETIVADPDMGSEGLFDPWIQDPGWVKKSTPESGMNIPDHISESLETIFGLKILNFSDTDPDPGSDYIWPWIRDGKIRIRDQE